MTDSTRLRILVALGAILVACAWASPAAAQKFFIDDPIWREPPPEDTIDPQHVMVSAVLEYFTNQFTRPGERQPDGGVIPAGNANTAGGVPDSPWFINRHGRVPMTLDELVAGAGGADPPSTAGPWRVLAVKPYGDRIGILIVDADNTLYLLRFDHKGYPELATGAEMISSRFYHAFGYNTMENYLVQFERDALVVGDGADKVTSGGELRDLLEEDIDSFLAVVDRQGTRYRAVATRAPYAEILGNYQFYGTRSDDPNDIVPHEHRRDLRGMWVFHAWLANDQFNPSNTIEVVASDGTTQYVQRYVLDFFKTLGSGDAGPKEARDGNEYRFDFDASLKNVAGMGIWTPGWMRADYPGMSSVGYFAGDGFDADLWRPDTHWATWANMLPDDSYWAAKIVMSFTDEEIRAIVNTGGYSDARATLWISDALIKRRDEIGRTFLQRVLPLDNFRVENGRLAFDDLMEVYGFAGPRSVSVDWYGFDNINESATIILGQESGSPQLPPSVRDAGQGEYFMASLTAGDPNMNVHVYLRRQGVGHHVVGVERNWPGKRIVESTVDVTAGVAFSRYASFNDRQKELLEGPARAYNELTDRDLSPEEWFNQLSLSERTTFDAVTHALEESVLTDENGDDIGTTLDLVTRVERIAGQYTGRGGDQQFRLYVDLDPEAEDVLQRSTQFRLGHANTVYHVGYPKSYRQEGEVPNIQVSISDDGLRADIDVDYRSSKSPQALFNGHLTSANSDVRAGDNYERHSGRWGGLVNWWQSAFGSIDLPTMAATDLLSRKIDELPTPLPGDRPLGAAPEELHEAAQEFFTDWLVRRKIDEAMHFMSRRVIACINVDDDNAAEILDVSTAVAEMREIMRYALDELDDPDNLTEAMDEVQPWLAEQVDRIESHPFERDFTIIQVTNQVAADYTCATQRGGDPPPMPGGPDAVGTYWGVLIRFKVHGDLGGMIGFLWDRQEGPWKIVSYDVIEQ